MMSICDRVYLKMCEHEIKTGKKPTAIYLGENQYRKLKEELRGLIRQSPAKDDIPHVTNLFGIDVYTIDNDKEHLNVA